MNDSRQQDGRAATRTGARRTAIALAAAGAVALGAVAVAQADRGDRGNRTERMVERVTDRLDLDDAQAGALGTLVDEVAGLRETLRGDGLRDELSALVAGPTLDQGGALALIESRSDALRAAAPALVAAAAAFHDGLDESQRAEIAELVERAGGHRGRGWHR